MKLLPLLLLLWISGSFAQDLGCGIFFEDLEKYPEIKDVFTRLQAIDVEKLKGSKLPRWRDFQDLEDLINQLKEAKVKLEAGGDLKSYDAILKRADEAYRDLEEFQAFRNAGRDAKVEDYLPTEYELKKLYLQTIDKLNAELPPSMRLAKFHLGEDKTKALVAKEAKKVVPDLDQKFEDYFKKSSGFESYEEYLAALKKLRGTNEVVDHFAKLMEEGQVRFVMARPESARWWIPKVGFHNQHVTGSSRGYMGNKGRNACEATYLGKPFDEYSAWSAELKPKYGYLEPTPESGVNPTSVHYGEDIFIFKQKNVEDRLTYSIGDSLNRLRDIHPGWSSGTEAAAHEEWDFLFIPWKYKEAMLPTLAVDNTVTSTLQFNRYGSDKKFVEDAVLEKFKMKSKPGAEYVELQYFGNLSLDDVERFEFKSVPPDKDFYEELKRRGIEVYDRRQWPPVKWEPEA